MTEITAKQEAFCAHYARHRSGPSAYVKAYDARNSSPSTIHSSASKLLADPKIKQRIKELTVAADAASDVTLEIADVFRQLCLQVTTDPRELMEVRRGNCRHCNGDGHAYRWREEEYQAAFDYWQKKGALLGEQMPDCSGGFGFRPFHPVDPECPECGGAGISHASFKPTDEYSPGAASLFEGVKQTKDGLQILTADRTKAREMLVRMLGGFDDKMTLKGQLEHVAAVVATMATDAHSAAQQYEEMLRVKPKAG